MKYRSQSTKWRKMSMYRRKLNMMEEAELVVEEWEFLRENDFDRRLLLGMKVEVLVQMISC